MQLAAVVERAEQVLAVRADAAADRSSIESALRASSQLRSWLASSDAALAARLAAQVSFPEKAIADCTRSSLNDAVKSKERSEAQKMAEDARALMIEAQERVQTIRDLEIANRQKAIELIEAKRVADANRIIRTFEENPDIQILNGRFGPYIKAGKKNVKIPKGREPASLTLEECLTLEANTPEKKGRGGFSKKAKEVVLPAPKKSKAVKKAPAKKTAAKPVAAKRAPAKKKST